MLLIKTSFCSRSFGAIFRNLKFAVVTNLVVLSMFNFGATSATLAENLFSKELLKFAQENKQNFIFVEKKEFEDLALDINNLDLKLLWEQIAINTKMSLLEFNGIKVLAPRENLDLFAQRRSLLDFNDTVDTISIYFHEVDIRDLLVLISRRVGVNIITSKTVRGRVTTNLYDCSWINAVYALATSLGFELRLKDKTILIGTPQEIDFLVNYPEILTETKDTVSIDFRDTDVREILKTIAAQFNRNFLAEKYVRGNATVRFVQLTENDAMNLVARSNGFEVELVGNTWIVGDGRRLQRMKELIDKNSYIPLQGKISIDCSDTDLRNVIEAIVVDTKQQFRISDSFSGSVTLRFADVSVAEIIRLLAAANGYIVKTNGEVVEISKEDDVSSSSFIEINPSSVSTAAIFSNKDTEVVDQVQVGDQIEDTNVQKLPPSLPPKPIKIVVLGIVENQSERRALIFFEGKYFIVGVGENVKDKFEVLRILPDEIVIYSKTEKIQKNFSLGRYN